MVDFWSIYKIYIAPPKQMQLNASFLHVHLWQLCSPIIGCYRTKVWPEYHYCNLLS